MKYLRYQRCFYLFAAFLLFQCPLLPAASFGTTAGYSWVRNGRSISITGFDQRSATAVIPTKIDGFPVTSITDEAFVGCVGVTNIIVPSGVTNIGTSTFSYCSRLMSITVPNSIQAIGENAFYGCNIVGITASDDVLRWMGSNAAELGISFHDFSSDYYNIEGLKTQSIYLPFLAYKKYGDPPTTLNGIASSKLPVFYQSSDTNVADFVSPNAYWHPGYTNIASCEIVPIYTNTNNGQLIYTNVLTTKIVPNLLWNSIEIPSEMNFVLSYTNTNTGSLYYSNSVFTNASLVPFEKIGNSTWAVPRFVPVQSNMPVTYTNTNTGSVFQTNIVITNFTPITIAPKLLIKGAGRTTITAYQFGDSVTYSSAKPVSQILIVKKLDQTITFPSFNKSIHYNSSPVRLNGYSSSGLPLSFNISDPQCTSATLSTNGNKTYLIPQGIGCVTIMAAQDGNENISAAIPVVRKLRIIP